MKRLAFAALVAASFVTPSMAQDDAKFIWGGGDPKTSTYSAVYVPHLIDILTQNRLPGYAWAGVSAGTLANAEQVTAHPTNLAVGQWDLLQNLNGQPNPAGGTYQFTVLAQDIGPECLYAVTDQVGYGTLGDVIGNAWDSTFATGGAGSGSLATFQNLQRLYPELADVITVEAGGALDIVKRVKTDAEVTHGFFVMRPDPQSETFQYIAEEDLHLIPLVDERLAGSYSFNELKVANGGLFSGPTLHVTACTSVALITGDPNGTAAQALDTRSQRRLAETIKRISAVDPETLKPNISSWSDMWDSFKVLAGDRVQILMDESKQRLEDILEDVAG